ncbi:MAG TPA: hypothetical protein VJW73_08540 [Gemmatimonadaceae bacterium]|nr:hypothetical protein [Gemmatimonadaceae bacterium]
MADQEKLQTFIDRVIHESRITDARERDALRRELESHFADVADSPEGLRSAMERFGSPVEVGGALDRAHRGSLFVRQLVRLALVIGASGGVALVLQLATNLRRDARSDAVVLAPAFARSIAFSSLLIVLLIAAWELDVEPFCARLERHPLRLVGTVGALALVMLTFHAATSTLLPPGIALSASAVDVAIWTCTVAILARADRIFARVFANPPRRGAP